MECARLDEHGLGLAELLAAEDAAGTDVEAALRLAGAPWSALGRHDEWVDALVVAGGPAELTGPDPAR